MSFTSSQRFVIQKISFSILILLIILFFPLINTSSALAAPNLQASELTVDIRIYEGNQDITPGDSVVLEIEVLNTGRAVVENAVIRALYEAGALQVSDVVVNSGRGWTESSPLGEDGEIIWEGVQLGPNQTWRVRYTMQVAQPFNIADLL